MAVALATRSPAWAARRGGRRVKWIPTRAEALLGDNQGRDRNIGAEFGARRQWQVPGSALERNAQCRRAYIAAYGAIPIVFSLMPASTVHDIPAVAVTSSLVFANTAPTTPYCGAGRGRLHQGASGRPGSARDAYRPGRIAPEKSRSAFVSMLPIRCFRMRPATSEPARRVPVPYAHRLDL